MKIVHITNLKDESGLARYKGLDLQKIVPGKQLYPPDKNEAYLFYDGEVPSNSDITIIDQETYGAEVTRIKMLPRPLTPEEEISHLKNRLEATESALLDLIIMGGM